MGCGCGGGNRKRDAETLGYLVTYPDGTATPESQPFLSYADAKVEIRRAGGGTIRRLVRRR